jgi:hypothetical protein
MDQFPLASLIIALPWRVIGYLATFEPVYSAKADRSANKFRKSQIRTFVDLNNLLDWRSFKTELCSMFWTFADLQFAD